MPTEIITQARLKELLHYCPESGKFVWRVTKGSRGKVSSEAGAMRPDGYIQIQIDGSLYLSHRLAFLYMTGEFPPDQTDHDNHVRADNRWDNLNEATNTTNHKNRPIQRNNTSGHVGVCWRKDTGKWWAQTKIDGKPINLGCFTNKADAIAARKKAEKKYGFHRNHGGLSLYGR